MYCNKQVVRCELGLHYATECDHYPTVCPQCDLYVVGLKRHLANCPKKVTMCQDCNCPVLLRELEYHIENECPEHGHFCPKCDKHVFGRNCSLYEHRIKHVANAIDKLTRDFGRRIKKIRITCQTTQTRINKMFPPHERNVPKYAQLIKANEKRHKIEMERIIRIHMDQSAKLRNEYMQLNRIIHS